MELILESTRREDYLREVPPVIRYDTPQVRTEIARIRAAADTPEERARLAFEVARDEVRHSFDTGNPVITITAEEVLEKREGICFAKAHLLASLLRGLGIPAGFCYQRVLRKDTVESGHALHGLNALWLERYGWFRVDPRGNKPGVDAQFSPESERLAYPIRPELGEVDYPEVHTAPLPAVVEAMRGACDSLELFLTRPAEVSGGFPSHP